MYESLIMRFSADHPCWTETLTERAGENAGGLEILKDKGLLASRERFYWLSDAGRRAFVETSSELFLCEEPGGVPDDPASCAMATGLWLELERCNLQRWGLKRYMFRPSLSVRPSLRRADVWDIKSSSCEPELIWRYPDNPHIMEVTKMPLPSDTSKRSTEPNPDTLAEWLELPPEPFVPDALLLVNYDFENYLDFKGHPLDELKIINTDRFFFSAAVGFEEQLDVLGKFHRWVLEQRYLRLPGYFDLDTQEQGSVNWLIFISETQEEALSAQARLKAFGPALIRPVNPMEIWVLSLEVLRECPSRREVIWDVLPCAGLPVCLTL